MDQISDNVSLSRSALNSLLPQLQDADDIKLMLFILSEQNRHEGHIFYLTRSQVQQSNELLQWIGNEYANDRIGKSLSALIDTERLLLYYENSIIDEPLIFLNDEKGQHALETLKAGEWRPMPTDHQFALPPSDDKNVFQLFEENIGPLTPLLAEDLTAAQEEYPQAWIKDAIHIAVQNNARSWRYINTILRAWQKEGKHDQPGRDSQANKRKTSKGKFDDFIQR